MKVTINLDERSKKRIAYLREHVDHFKHLPLNILCQVLLETELLERATEIEKKENRKGRWTGTGIGDAGGYEGLTPPEGWTRDPNE